MRSAFFDTLTRLAAEDPRVTLVVGDIGFGLADVFAEAFPAQFVNAGVAEQHMTGLATGLALDGRVVFTYSIGNFPTLRCLEQIRNDVCYHNVNVTVVTAGGGLSYGALGASHHTTEDIAVMRVLPEMVVVAPGDPVESALATRAVAAHRGPCYLRLGRAGEPVIHAPDVPFALGRAIVVRDGHDLTLISTGAMLSTAVDVAGMLAADGIRARVLSMHTVKPLDDGAVLAAARETGAIATIEEHSLLGGLGGAVAEVLAESDDRVPFQRIALPAQFCDVAGTQEYLKARAGLDAAGVMESVRRLIRRATAVFARLPETKG
jgi:transketolase